MAKVKEADLRKAVKELNDVLGLKPPIGDDLEREELEEELKYLKEENFIKPKDKFTDETTNVLVEYGLVSKNRKVMPKANNEAVKRKEKVNKEKKKEGKPVSNYRRIDALNDALKKGGTRSELVEMSGELYEEKTGVKHVRVASRNFFDVTYPTLVYFGIVKVSEDGIIKLA
jgi:hypothetical protein